MVRLVAKSFLLFLFFIQCAFGTEISLKFNEGLNISLEGGLFVIALPASDPSDPPALEAIEVSLINTLISLTPTPPSEGTPIVKESFDGIPKETLSQWKANAEIFWAEPMEELSAFYSIYISDIDAATISSYLALANLSIVENIEIIPDPVPAQATTPLFESNQGYLNNDTNGIYAKQAWLVPGGKGNNVNMIDIEGAWTTAHEDFPTLFYTSGNFINSSVWLEHGTAVVGIIGAKDNGFGMTGIANMANIGVQTFNGTTFAAAITQAAMQVGSGGIIILETQYSQAAYTPVCSCNVGQCGFIAAEFYESQYSAIKQAVGNGVVVVEAAGNGSVDFDNPALGGKMSLDFRDSGAILVAASLHNSRAPACFTNYGSRIDAHGWGQSVATLGYGGLFNASDTRKYTNFFSGTSSATPIVAGAAASIQGILIAQGKSPLNSRQMRKVLRETGSIQTDELSKHIGNLPNIIAAVDKLGMAIPFLPPLLYLLLLDDDNPPPP